ncbi:MAG: hypothetical protein WAN60_11050 [Candidatus Sulfotelmatobacter sp.]
MTTATHIDKHTGPGKLFIKVASGMVQAWLYNFDIEGSGLKAKHEDVLKYAVGPLLQDGGSIRLLGLTSTTGQAAYDKQLGAQRIRSVVHFLRTRFGSKFFEGSEISLGKDLALAAYEEPNVDPALRAVGTADDAEAEVWRAVVINAWNRSLPPPPPTGVPFDDNTWAEDLGQGIDKLSFGLGIIDLLADLKDMEVVTNVTGPGGLILGCIGSILQLPLLFISTDAVANLNGQIQGAADAIQDMADQYSGNELYTKPLSDWPAVKVPTIHIIDSTIPTASQEAWRAGQTAGLLRAVQKVLDLEQNPKPITLPGSGKHIRLSGRLWLRNVSRAYKDNAGIEIVIKPANEDLAKRGKKPFPTI